MYIKKLTRLLTEAWSIFSVILCAGAFYRKVTEDGIDNRRDIGFRQEGVINFFRIIFAIHFVVRISHSLMLCMGWNGTSAFLLHGSPSCRGCLFLKQFLVLLSILLVLFTRPEFTSLFPNWKKAHVKCCACMNSCQCSLMYQINAPLWLNHSLV